MAICSGTKAVDTCVKITRPRLTLKKPSRFRKTAEGTRRLSPRTAAISGQPMVTCYITANTPFERKKDFTYLRLFLSPQRVAGLSLPHTRTLRPKIPYTPQFRGLSLSPLQAARVRSHHKKNTTTPLFFSAETARHEQNPQTDTTRRQRTTAAHPTLEALLSI